MRILLVFFVVAICLPAQSVPCAASDELAEIYAADQDDRKENPIDWSVVGRRDRARRERVGALIAAAELRCPADFFHAAMVYQHGHSSSHYLLAHILATAAAFQGHDPAIKLSASTFDRYLGTVGQPQVFGTQLRKMPWEDDFSPEPFDREIVPDFVRQLYNVPSLVDLEARLERRNQGAQP